MRFYTGDESGLVKGIDIDANVSLLEAQAQAAKRTKAAAKAKATLKAGEQAAAADTSLDGVNMWTVDGTVSRSRSIQQMCHTPDASALAVARRNGAIDVVGYSGEQLFTYTEPLFAEKLGAGRSGRTAAERRYVGLGATATHFVSCSNMGEVRFQAHADGAAKLIKLPEDAYRMRTHSARPHVFAVGGREHELSVWDAEHVETAGAGFAKPRSAPLFRARNVANDFLDLRVPVWVTDIQFTSADAASPTLAVATGHGQIRLYDARAQQRPVHDWEASRHPIYHVLASHVRPELFFADNMGNVQQMDMRTGHVFGAFKGVAGAVKSMALSEDGAKIAVAGLDRFVRVYETGSMRRPLHRAYVKQRVSCVVWDWGHKDYSAREIEEQEAEVIWETMDKSALKKKSNKRKAVAT
ncbi:Ribosome biogenesis protein nsa1 (NOP7-associated protein 1) [Coemansia erecta]|nr:Ribosome biogenesis protein nsa1 (NOP7-associated protein 1) [Coemansia sp. RSA 2618]KAJ2828090.1 Ribosome biogenesis protein nsa1 (NOP7-associated protein 1) [Coemansia erecta]